MKKILSSLSLSFIFFEDGEALSTYNFDIEGISDSIVGRLLDNIEVPEEEIKELFELVEKSNNKRQQAKIASKELINNVDKEAKKATDFISQWKESILAISEDKIESKIMEEFISNITKVQSKFPSETMQDSLNSMLHSVLY